MTPIRSALRPLGALLPLALAVALPARAQPAEAPAAEAPAAEAPAAEAPAAEAPAAEAPAAEAPAAAGPRLPELLEAAPAVYPQGALATGRGAVVPLLLGVDASGAVVEVQVLEPQGDGFDEAAEAAARAFRFRPALDAEGQPSPATVQYNYRFEARVAARPALTGTLAEAGVRSPLGGVTLRATGPGGAEASVVTSDDGSFTFYDLPPGEWLIAASGGPFRTLTETLTLSDGKLTELELYLVRDARQEALATDFEFVIEDRRASSEISERVLSADEIKYLPGTGGDVVKVVQNLPGVARSPLGTGTLIIRGTAPEDSRFFLDGSPIPLVFHFGGLTTVVNNDLIKEVAYLPGNFSVRYGRIVGGLVDVRTKTELPERSNGYLAVDVYQTTLFIEQKVGERSFISLSGRRSYIDAVLSPLLSGGSLQVQAPRYYDGQLRYFHKTDAGATYDALFFFTDDAFAFVGGEDEDGEEEVFASFGDRFQRLRLRRTAELGGGWTEETVIGIGPEKREFQLAELSEAYEQRFTVSIREELGVPLSAERSLGGRFGLDLLSGEDSLLFDEARLDEVEQAESFLFAPGLYGELSWRKGPLTLIPGLRGDLLLYGAGYTGAAVDPRVNSRLVLGQSTTLLAGVGRFSSLPTLRQVAEESDGNPALTFPWSLQSSVGVEQRITGRLTGTATAFYNRLNDLVVGREDRLRFFTGPPPVGPFDTDPYANDGVGMVCGVEGQIKYTGPASVGLLVATFSHSERQDRPDEPEELFAYDQPVVLNALWSQQLGRNWRLGGRLRYSSGNPYTPVSNRVYDMATREFIPVFGERSSARLPAFFSFDVRIDKTYVFKKWQLETYLDIQNATVAQNPEVIAWTYDYRELDPITSNPPLPVFGLKGSW